MHSPPLSWRCEKCGADLTAYTAEGLCPACMLESGVEDERGVEQLAAPAEMPSVFGEYELLEEIARGGMGVIYKARQTRLNRFVAVKMMLGGPFGDPKNLARFRAEAKTVAQLQHPNIIAIHEVGEHDGLPFFSMDYVEGRNLSEIVGNTPLPIARAARYVKAISEAVHYAHQHGVLHRDLKPSNVLIDSSDQPRVTDFGLAKSLEGDSSLTISGQVLGSPSFISPEQAAGKSDGVGPASDVYSLGAILYHLLTTRPPFVAETMTQTLRMVEEQEPVSPRLLNASVPRDLETICLKCLQKEPQGRYDTAQELAEDITRFLRDEPIHAGPVGAAEKLWRWCRRNRALAATGATVLALLLVLAIGSPIAALRINHERETAEQERRQEEQLWLQAEANGKKAETQARKSQETARFLASILEGVGPSVALGRDITMLKEILDRTVNRIRNDLQDQPEVKADLLMVIGKTYGELGLYTNALETTQEALRLRQAYLGSNGVAVGDAIANIAAFHYSSGDLPAAERANREALEMRRQLLGNNNTNVATSLNNLSLAVWSQGRLKEAETYQTEALNIRRRLLSETNLEVGKSLANLASIQWVRGNYSGAAARMTEALKVFRSQLGEEHPHVATLQNNLATMLARKGELTGAEALHRNTLEVRRRVLNGKHDDIAYSLTQLATVLTDSGKLDEAETNLLDAWKMEQELALGDHPNVADTLAGLGAVLAKKGDLAAAETNHLAALELRKKLLGADNPDVADSLDALAVVTAMRGDLTRAKELLAEGLALNEKRLGREHVNMVPLLYHLAWVLRLHGEVASAVTRRDAAMAVSSKNGVYGAWPLLKSIYDLTDILQTQDRFIEVEPLLAEAADYAQNNLDQNGSLQRNTFQHLAMFYEAWDRSEPNTGKGVKATEWRKKINVQ